MGPSNEDLIDFAKFVAREIFDPDFENGGQYAFAELACRKLYKLGIVTKADDKWIFVYEDDAEA